MASEWPTARSKKDPYEYGNIKARWASGTKKIKKDKIKKKHKRLQLSIFDLNWDVSTNKDKAQNFHYNCNGLLYLKIYNMSNINNKRINKYYDKKSSKNFYLVLESASRIIHHNHILCQFSFLK